MKHDVDYHVGILRGFVLAHNAHQTVLHALDVLLTDYRSKAGESIGRTEPEPPLIIKDLPIKIEHKLAEITPEDEPKNNYFWSSKDDEILYQLYCVEGKGPAAIADIVGRTKQSVSNRAQQRGLKRGSAKPS